MKTLTEFPAPTLKNAATTRAQLMTEGKTGDDLTTALTEALKVDAAKLALLTTALDIIGTRTDDLKRVVVYKLEEGQTAPKNVVQNGEHHFLVEYYPPMPGSKRGKGGFKGKGKFSKGKKKRFGKRGERGGRDNRGGRGPGARGTAPGERSAGRFGAGRTPGSENTSESQRPRQPRFFPKNRNDKNKPQNPRNQKPTESTNPELASIRAKALEMASQVKQPTPAAAATESPNNSSE